MMVTKDTMSLKRVAEMLTELAALKPDAKVIIEVDLRLLALRSIELGYVEEDRNDDFEVEREWFQSTGDPSRWSAVRLYAAE